MRKYIDNKKNRCKKTCDSKPLSHSKNTGFEFPVKAQLHAPDSAPTMTNSSRNSSPATLKDLEDPNKCSAPQIMQDIVLRLDILKTQGKLVSFHWIPSHKDIKGNEEADIAAKEATGWRKAKRKNGKCKEWDSGSTSEKKSKS